MARLAPSGFLDANAPATATTTTPVSTPAQAAERLEPGATGSTTPLIDPVSLAAGVLANVFRGGLLGAATRAVTAEAPAAAAEAPAAPQAAMQAIRKVVLGDPVKVEAYGGGDAFFHPILDQDGRAIAGMTVSFPQPDRALVRGLYPMPGTGVGPTTLGPSHVRSLLRQFKDTYPEVKMLGGTRVTGVSTGMPRFTTVSLGSLAAALGLGTPSQESQ